MTDETNPCQEQGVYYLPYPYDCKQFVQCNNGRFILMPCPEGTEWDDNMQMCNWPEEAQCVDLPRP